MVAIVNCLPRSSFDGARVFAPSTVACHRPRTDGKFIEIRAAPDRNARRINPLGGFALILLPRCASPSRRLIEPGDLVVDSFIRRQLRVGRGPRTQKEALD